jgi:bifunctional non-homologous end joining protein LigD
MPSHVSNPDRVIFPDVGLTKADIVGYYDRVGESMMAFLRGRPLTLQRFPRGVDAKGFMQKNAAEHFPDTIARFPVPKRDGSFTNYPVVTEAGDLAYLANQGTVTFHMWTATVDRPNHPDWMVFDLDPEQDDPGGARFGLQAVRSILAEFGLDGFPLATGSKGFHLWVRLDGSQAFGDISLATRAIAGLTAHAHPDALTTAFLKKERAGRVFVDWLRNTNIATVVVPFSLRPTPAASVAVPLAWDEVDEADPAGWTLTSLGDRLEVPTDTPPCTVPVDQVVDAARAAGVDLDTPHDRFGRRRQ